MAPLENRRRIVLAPELDDSSCVPTFFNFPDPATGALGGKAYACRHFCPSKCCPIIFLHDPRDAGEPHTYLSTATGIFELNIYSPSLGSWFIGNSIVSDPSMTIGSQVDPLLLLLPALTRLSEAGSRFVGMEDILEEAKMPYFLCQRLTGEGGEAVAAEDAAKLNIKFSLICDVQRVGPDSYYRLNKSHAAAWLVARIRRTAGQLRESAPEAWAGVDAAVVLSYARGLICEYVAPVWTEALDVALGRDESKSLDLFAQAAAAACAPVHDGSSMKRSRDPKELAREKAALARKTAKTAKSLKEAAGMRKLSGFFTARSPST